MRIRAEGKFLVNGEQKFYVRGVTYGPFGHDGTTDTYGTIHSVDADFRLMASNGINTVRVYSMPPRWLLDLAAEHGLRVMVGLAWAQHIAFLQSRSAAREIIEQVRKQVRAVAGHPAILCYAVGNEIPGHIVRWYGHRKVEQFVRRLYDAVKVEDAEALVTYVNYPSTEYLDLSFLDFISFNLYLESPQELQAYVSRLQNIAGNRPLMVAELGLDSLRNGESKQAETMAWQIRSIFDSGAAGVIVFSWTDEWFRGGAPILDWAFGLTTRDRHAKPALEAVSKAFAERSLPAAAWLPMVSVVVCTYNGGRTLGQCLRTLGKLDYPRYEVIVVDDGSTDDVAAVAQQHEQVRLIRTDNRGLSSARSTGLAAAKGAIIAYIDDDAFPDEHWLRYLVLAFESSTHVGIGGPNIPPSDDGTVAACVARAPGGPVHVLITDQLAEHIPGCNMAFRVEALRAIDGFDPQFRIAGDDVDVCWRLQDRGWTLGFSPAAVVWHHRRNSVRGYWRQQLNYGRAEADLERKWPEKYNAVGHLTWSGRLYGPGLAEALCWWSRRRIYHGQWGSALFQSVYHVPPSLLSSLPMMPEWYLLIALLPLASLPAMHFPPMLCLLALSAVCTLITISLAWGHAADVSGDRLPLVERLKRRLLTSMLYLIQPAARLLGRVQNGLHPWRHHGAREWSLPWHRELTAWDEKWKSPADRACELETSLRRSGAVVLRNGEFDRWDIEVRGGMAGRARVYFVVEEHGQGRQLVRLDARPHVSRTAKILLVGLNAVVIAALAMGSIIMGVAFAIVSAAMIWAMIYECGVAIGSVAAAFKSGEVHADAAATPAPEKASSVEPLEADEIEVMSVSRT